MYNVKLKKNYMEVNFLFADFDKAAAFVRTALDGFDSIGYEDDSNRNKNKRFLAELSVVEGVEQGNEQSNF